MTTGAQLQKAQRPDALGLSDRPVADKMDLSEALQGHWLPVGRIEELPDIGSYFTWERTGVPTLFVRSTDHQIRGFYNSCRHRGAPVVRSPTGRSRAFRCQYHSWTYDSFGQLLSIPDERDFGDIDRCTHGLIALPLVERGGWLWANADRQAADATASLTAYEPIQAMHQSLVFQGRATYILDADWGRVQPHVQRIDPEQNIAPNLRFDQRDGCCYLLAVWPRDDWRLSIEVVAIATDTAGAPHIDAQQYLDNFVADIAVAIA